MTRNFLALLVATFRRHRLNADEMTKLSTSTVTRHGEGCGPGQSVCIRFAICTLQLATRCQSPDAWAPDEPMFRSLASSSSAGTKRAGRERCRTIKHWRMQDDWATASGRAWSWLLGSVRGLAALPFLPVPSVFRFELPAHTHPRAHRALHAYARLFLLDFAAQARDWLPRSDGFIGRHRLVSDHVCLYAAHGLETWTQHASSSARPETGLSGGE